MSETTPEESTAGAQAAQPPAQESQSQSPPSSQEATDWKSEARKWEDRAKANKKAADELERQRQATMSEAERAVLEAETRGRSAAALEFGKRLAKSEFDSLAGRRNSGFDTSPVFEYLDLGRLVGEDGEPDSKAIKAAVDRLVPEPQPTTPSYDGGARTAASSPVNMNDLVRRMRDNR